ncbi:MAG TPA: sulfotransferase domain-containing protein [Verrucomicrobiae bacterium]
MERWIAAKLLGRPEIKIHGLLRVGTNYVQSLLNANFRVVALDSMEGGWKHGPCDYSRDRKFVFVVKNPYAWLVSFQHWEQIHNRSAAKTLAEFATQPVSHKQLREAWGENTPVETWNKALKSWLAYSESENTVFVRYEDLINGFASQLTKIEQQLGLKAKFGDFVNIHTRADNWKTKSPRKPLEIDFYKHEKYLEAFDAPTLAILRQQFDPNLLERFGYQLI